MHDERNGNGRVPRADRHSAAPAPHPEIDPLLTDFDLERVTGRARSTWQKARLTGDGPPFIRLGRLVRYRQSDFELWLAAHPSLRSTSEAGVIRSAEKSQRRAPLLHSG
jgi:hypothetical protein